MGAELWLAVAEHPRSLGAEAIARRDDVFDLVADMVHAARRIAVEKAAHRRSGTERLEEFNPGIRQFDKNHPDTVPRKRLRLRDLRAKNLPIKPTRRCEIRHHDRHVV